MGLLRDRRIFSRLRKQPARPARIAFDSITKQEARQWLIDNGLKKEADELIKLKEDEMRLGNFFTYYEMTRSMTAQRLGIENKPSEEELQNLKNLCSLVLDPIRLALGPVRVNSGFRCKELNDRIGGSQTSEHCKGQAADIEIVGFSNLMLAEWIRESDLPFNQLILEYHNPDRGVNSGWVHVSHAKQNKRQTLTASRIAGKTVYSSGLMFS